MILFDPARAWEFELRRKRGGAPRSPSTATCRRRWRPISTATCGSTSRAPPTPAPRGWRRGSPGCPAARIEHPVEANEVFAAWPRADHRRALDAGAQYYLWSFAAPHEQMLDGPGADPVGARLVCGWSTGEAEIDRLLAILGAAPAPPG